jgi:inorganic pyrophosphatase
MEISESPDGVMSQAFYKKDNVITVEPWPFKNDTFKVFYEYKVVEQLQFKSIEAFNEVYKKTPVARKVFVFAK